MTFLSSILFSSTFQVAANRHCPGVRPPRRPTRLSHHVLSPYKCSPPEHLGTKSSARVHFLIAVRRQLDVAQCPTPGGGTSIAGLDHRLKRESTGLIMAYGGVRMARTLLHQRLVDELELDICPMVLGTGQPLFTDSKQRSSLRLRESSTYESGTTMVHYDLTPP